MRKIFIKFVFIFLLLITLIPINNAKAAEDWEFKFSPYIWFTDISGDVTANGRESEIDVSFEDIWDDLNFALLFDFEAMYRGKYGFYLSPVYMNLNDERDGEILVLDTEIDTLIFEGGFIYNLLTTTSGNPDQNTKFDFLLGGRLWYLETDLEVEGPMGGDFGVEDDVTWFDFLAGLRFLYEYKKFDFAAKTDIGGFNLGFSSDISWSIGAWVGYEIFRNFTPFIGYRALYADYDDGSGDDRFVYDAWTYGPMLGFQLEF